MQKSENVYPKTIEEAVDKLLLEMHDRLKNDVMHSTEEDLVKNFNLGLGTYIKNAFGLWNDQNPELLRDCISENIHPDEASKIILKALWKRLQEKEKR